MVQLIVGKKGKGKTKHLLDKVNSEVQQVPGSIVYLDKSTKHMYELNNKIRLIDVSSYFISDSSEFIGFVSGIISQDHDLQQMYFDSFLKIACLEEISYKNGWIDKETLLESSYAYGKSPYGKHLKNVAEGKILY